MLVRNSKRGPDGEGVGGDRSHAVQKGHSCLHPIVHLAYQVTYQV